MVKKLDIDDLARMAQKGFTDIGERMAIKDDFKLLVEELNATHADVRYIRKTSDMLTE